MALVEVTTVLQIRVSVSSLKQQHASIGETSHQEHHDGHRFGQRRQARRPNGQQQAVLAARLGAGVRALGEAALLRAPIAVLEPLLHARPLLRRQRVLPALGAHRRRSVGHCTECASARVDDALEDLKQRVKPRADARGKACLGNRPCPGARCLRRPPSTTRSKSRAQRAPAQPSFSATTVDL